MHDYVKLAPSAITYFCLQVLARYQDIAKGFGYVAPIVSSHVVNQWKGLKENRGYLIPWPGDGFFFEPTASTCGV